jgi:hypothetical protein
MISPHQLWSLVKQSVDAWLEDRAPSMGAALAYYTAFHSPLAHHRHRRGGIRERFLIDDRRSEDEDARCRRQYPGVIMTLGRNSGRGCRAREHVLFIYGS